MIATKKPRPRTPKLPLTDVERRDLRFARLTLGNVADRSVEELAAIMDSNQERAQFLKSSALFQRLDHIGPETAKDLWVLGYRGYEDLVAAEPARMYEDLCAVCGVRLDPCVEDSLRLCVAQVRYPDLPDESLRWWAWSAQRGQPLRRPG